MSADRHELCIVVPVYNESGAIGAVLSKWSAMLDSLGIDWQLHAYNDGSRDNSSEILSAVAKRSNGRIVAHDKTNSGHGPTILLGYRENAEHCDWLFQMDSDDEMGPEGFPQLWEQRATHDFLLGKRDGRAQPFPRKIVSLVSRLSVRVFYGKSVWDVNSPYRLMRAEKIKPWLAKIPEKTFAPNVILSGLAGRKKLRLFEAPVQHGDRTTGEVSIKKWKLFKAAAKSFWQTIAFSFAKV